MWSPFKELYHVVETALYKKQPDAVHDLEVVLRKHKPDFISLLTNPAKNNISREAVKKASTEGLTIQGQQSTQILSQQFIEEALIISDLFDLNEYAAVELLMAGDNQLPHFPGLTKGLVAVLLYYDGRRSLVNSLRALIQSRAGRTWTVGCSEELVAITTRFTDQLMEEGLTNKILGLLSALDLTKEMDKLQKERALGHAKHRKQVIDVFNEIKTSLAECLFCWACQFPLGKTDTLRLLAHLRTDSTTNPDGSLEGVTLAILMTLLYSLDIRLLEQEEAEEMTDKLPILTDRTYVPDVHKEITSQQKWANPQLKAVVQFAWALTLRTLSQQSNAQGSNEYCEEDEQVVDMAIEADVFQFLRDSVLASPTFFQEEFYLRQLHNLITDFIVQMPLKVKELRNRGDEAARIIMAHAQEGLEPPSNLQRDFEKLLGLIADFYSKDPLNVELTLEFWCPVEATNSPSMTGFTTMYHHRPPHRQISLFKFVRLAGDLLPPTLYIPYICMLSGLSNGPQSAHHCFNLLKTNGMPSGGHASTVSWDHFFMSMNQYYTSLRQELPSGLEISHVYRHHSRGITPQELDGLVSVLNLTRVIAEQDESARIALCENQQWLPVVLMLGLVGCSVPSKLKAELLLTLAAFGRTPDFAASLWQSLEVSQILPTVNSNSVHQSGGIQVELDEVEARNEEFPMTRAFLTLMDVLTDIPVPAALGAGYRAPGFDPYLDFLKDSVFFKFNTRAYKNPGEKWEVATAVLEIFYKLLHDHEVSPEDFVDQPVEVQGGGTALANKSPGHTLLIHMLNDGGMLKMVLYVIDEATKLLAQYTDFPGKEKLKRTSLLCLRLIQIVLEKQEQFMYMVRESGSSAFVSPMDKLLMGINPRSGKPDHLVNIAKYVMFNESLPEHALAAVKTLCWVCQSALVQPELVGLFTEQQSVCDDLLHGFVECLETDEVEEPVRETEDQDESMNQGQIRNATRQTIMKLMLHTIDQPAPNLAHFLLGFEIRKAVSKTNLQDPGVLGSSRTCLHSILSILDNGLDTKTGPLCIYETPRLAELAYHMIYVLCANKDTSSPTMRYLRTTHDFLFRHLQHVPFKLPEHVESPSSELLLLKQQSWLLKSVAIELRLTAANRQRSNTQRLLNLLLEDATAQPGPGARGDFTMEGDFTHIDMDRTAANMSQFPVGPSATGGQSRRKLLSLVDTVSFVQDQPDPLQLEFFDTAIIEQVIMSCETRNEQGIRLCDVKMLYKILLNEVNNFQGTSAAGQRPLVVQEVQSILATLVKTNFVRESTFAKRQAFEAWRQVVEIILTACPVDQLQGEARQNVIFELLQHLLMKVSDKDAAVELSAPVAGVILTLVANLRQCFLPDPSQQAQGQNSSQYVTLLDGSTAADSTNQSGVFSQQSGTRTLFATSLQVVLRGLIEHILRTSSSQQRVRANLYGALLYYLQISHKPRPIPTSDSGVRASVGAAITAKESESDKLNQANLSTIMNYGENFMEVLCRDACDGHHVGRMLALACLDNIINIDRHQQWLSYLSSKGYIQHLVDSLLHDDEHLQSMLSPNPEPLRALYVYESKMGLLTKVAESAAGAHTLLQCGLTVRLAECGFFDLRPEYETRFPAGIEEHSMEGFVPNIMSRYRQLLFPALKLCLAVLASLGSENRDAGKQVLQFIIAHSDVFNTILRDKHMSLSLPALKELALTTDVVGRAAIEVEENELMAGDTAAMEFRGHLARIQRQMIALLPRYTMTERLNKQLKNMETEEIHADGRDAKSDMQLAILEITANVVAFCRSLISKSGGSSAQFRSHYLWPSLMEAMARDMQSVDDLQGNVSVATRAPNLGIVVYLLRQYTNEFLATYDQHKRHVRKLSSLAELSNEELKELTGSSAIEKLSAQQRQQLARKRLVQIISYGSQQLQLYCYITENCLFILWRHLQYYLIHCIPADQGASLFNLRCKKQPNIRRLQDFSSGSPYQSSMEEDQSGGLEQVGSSGVSEEELMLLKHDAVACINESIFKKLQEIEKCYAKARSRYGFIEALVRRLKRLLRLHTGQAS